MTLTSVLTKVQYAGDDATTVFPTTFVFYEDDGIRVILTVDATGVETVQTLSTHYTLSGGSGANGNVTMITAPATGETLTVKSAIADIQETSLPLGGDFPSTSVEERLDIITRLIQQMQEEVSRAILFSESSTSSGFEFPDPVTGEYLKWDASGNLINTTLTDAGAASGVDLTDTDTTKDKMISNFIGKTWEDYKDVGHLPLAGGTLTGGLIGTTASFSTIAHSGILTSSAAINEKQGANIASAATTNIGAATGNYITVTGTTTITALGTIQAGTRRIVHFSGVLILTHNATSLQLPTAANITTAVGDVATFVSEGSGNWRCINYMREDGTALAGAAASQGAQAWVNFNGTGTAAINDSFNMTSITDNGTGDFTLTVATDFANTNYSFVGWMEGAGAGMCSRGTNKAVGSIDVDTIAWNDILNTDVTENSGVFHGDQ